MEWRNVFSGGVSFARVNIFGIILMAVSVVLVALAGRVSPQTAQGQHSKVWYALKFGGVLLCAAGAMIAILGNH